MVVHLDALAWIRGGCGIGGRRTSAAVAGGVGLVGVAVGGDRESRG